MARRTAFLRAFLSSSAVLSSSLARAMSSGSAAGSLIRSSLSLISFSSFSRFWYSLISSAIFWCSRPKRAASR